MHKLLLDFLTQLVGQPHWHARWLNTLSFLEYIGARKIIKSQEASSLDLMILEHIAEETRHAYFFKGLSEKVLPGACPNYRDSELLAGRQSEEYFQALDSLVSNELGSSVSRLNYLYVTWLIEERAVSVYKLYSQVVRQTHGGIRLQAILNEENRHLEEMRFLIQKLDPKQYLDRQKLFIRKEEVEYEQLLKVWLQTLNGSKYNKREGARLELH